MLKSPKNNHNYIALSAMCKENIVDIIEWMQYHFDIGVDYFILYNNNPNENIQNLLPTHLRKVCDVIDWFYDFNGRQVLAQKQCIQKYQNFRWIGFLDIDEYIVLLESDTDIKSYMIDYERFGGLCLHWLLFGANDHISRQDSTIYAYTQSCPSHVANIHIKSIINPKHYTGYHYDPHFIPTSVGNVNTKGERVLDAFGSTNLTGKPPVLDYKMRINHYYTRSKQDFDNKILRKGGNMTGRLYTDEHFNSHQQEKVFNNDIILMYNQIRFNNGKRNRS